MPRTFALFAMPLLAVPLLPLPGRADAGLSEKMMTMAFDEVADGLRTYRTEKNPEKRLAWLQTIGVTRDPRVALALVDAANNQNGDDLDCEAAELLWWYYASPDAASHRGLTNQDVVNPPPGKSFRSWWKANESEIRRRAAQLSR
jgi:hypothetical protein